VVVAVVWPAKLGAVAVGLAFMVAGGAIARYGAPAIVALNKTYARLPGRFQYPPWWHRLLGAMFAAFGLLIAVVGGILAGR
jgi:hypothetical protein